MGKDIDPLDVQFHPAYGCIRACVYADHIGRLKPKAMAWPSICEILYADAVISWNALFGVVSQKTHWKTFTKDLVIPVGANIKSFGIGVIVEYLRTTPEEWRKFHAAMVDFQNRRLAHFDPSVAREDFPNLTWAMHSAYLYREWLLLLFRVRQLAGESIKITDTTAQRCLMY